MALQSGSNKKIDLYSKLWENKLQAFTKADVIYKCNVTQEVLTCTIVFAVNRDIYYWVIFTLHNYPSP